ncbi:MAG: DUF4055 domain-containing protein [Rhodospirillales bacterium]
MPIDTPNNAYMNHVAQWRRIRDALAGEDAVKARASSYLLIPASFNWEDRDGFVRAANWFPATARTHAGLTGAIFRKDPIVTADDQDFLSNVTGNGTPFTPFARSIVSETIALGRVGVIVDVALDGKPYLARYQTENILNTRTTIIDGRPVLSMVVLRETASRPKQDDRFVTEEVKRYRLLELARTDSSASPVYAVTIFERGRNGIERVEGPMIPTKRGRPLDFIPFVVISPSGLSPTAIEQSPLLGLVDMNFAHFRNSADYENSIFHVGSPMYVLSGLPIDGDKMGEVRVGANNVLWMSENGKVELIQASAESVGALAQALSDKEQRMAVLGARLLEKQKSGKRIC